MKLESTPIAGLYVAQSTPFVDSRGSFVRCFCVDELSSILDGRRICQINHSRTTQVGAVRGLHFQNPPFSDMKMVRCLHGKVWDIAVDLRTGSDNFLQWYALELSASNHRMFVIPEGFAHGFQVLEADSELLYLHTSAYKPEAEGGIHVNDPQVGIEWPMEIRELSPRDQRHPLLDADFGGIAL